MAATKGKAKELQIKKTTNGLHYYIDFEDGGQVPEALKGLFTKPTFAQQAIDKYVASRRKSRVAAES